MRETPKIEVDFSDFKKVFEQLVQKLSNKRDKWELHISKEANCYLLTGKPGDYNHTYTITWSIEEDGRDELKADKRLLYEIIDYFAIIGLKVVQEKTK